MFFSAPISARLRVAAASLLTATALGVAAPTVATAGPTDDLLKAVAPAAVTEVVAPVTTAAAPVTDPVVAAARPATDPVVEAATPVTQEVEQVVEPIARPVSRPVDHATKPVVEALSEEVVSPVANRAAPVARRVADDVVTPVAKRAAPVARRVANDVVTPVAETVRTIADPSQADVVGDTNPSSQRDDRGRRLSARPGVAPLGAATPATPAPTSRGGTAQDSSRVDHTGPASASRGTIEHPAVDLASTTSATSSAIEPGPNSAVRPTPSDQRTRSTDDAAKNAASSAPAPTPVGVPSAPSAASSAATATGATSNPAPAALGVLPDPAIGPSPGQTPASSTPVTELTSVHLASGSERPG